MIQLIFSFIWKHNHINWAIADQIIVSGVNFLTGILVARFLGIEEFGRFTLIWMIVLFVNSIQMAMIISPMMSIAPKQAEKDLSYYFGAIASQQFIFSIIFLTIIIVGMKLSIYFYPEWHIDELVVPVSMAAFFFQLQDFIRRVFFVQGRQVAAFLNDALSYLGQLLLIIYFSFQNDFNIEIVLWVISITSALAVIVGILLFGRVSWSYETFVAAARRHWKSARWLTGSALLQWLSGNLFILAAASILGATAVGALKAAQNIMAIVHVFFQALENIVPIHAGRYLHEEGKAAMLRYLVKVSLWGGVATLMISLFVSVLPELLLTVIFGKDYQGYGYVLQLYAVIYLIAFFALPLRIGLRAMEKTSPLFFAYILMAIFSLISAKPIVQEFGLYGVLAGILSTGGILLMTLLIFMQRIYKNYPVNEYK